MRVTHAFFHFFLVMHHPPKTDFFAISDVKKGQKGAKKGLKLKKNEKKRKKMRKKLEKRRRQGKLGEER